MTETPAIPEKFRWDRLTASSALSYCVLVAGLSVGVVLGELRSQFHLDGVTAALHGSMFGIGLVACGIWGVHLVDRIGRRHTLTASILAIVGGVTLLCVGPSWPITLTGTAFSGTGCALMVLVMPGLISDHHGPNRAVAFSAVNGVPGLAALMFSMTIGIFLSAHHSWRPPYLTLTVVFALALAVVAWPVGVPEGEREPGYSLAGLRSREVAVPWMHLIVETLAEFPIGVWAVAYMHEVGGAGQGAAAVLSTSFGLGMFLARMTVQRILARFGDSTLSAGFGALAVATAALCFVPNLAVRTVALGLAGFASGPLYPLTVDRFYTRVGHRLDSVTLGAYCAFASGIAITLGPLGMGVIADVVGLRWAVLLVPTMAVLGAWLQRPRRTAAEPVLVGTAP